MDLKKRGMLAIIPYLKAMGIEVLDEDFDGYIVIRDMDDIAIIDVFVTQQPLDEFDPPVNRKKFEQVLWKFFSTHDIEPDVHIRFDIISICVLREDRAVLRHKIDVKLEA